MRKWTVAVAVLALSAMPSLASADDSGIRSGVGAAVGGVVVGSAAVDAPARGGLIDFDGAAAPCTFFETVALRRVGGVKFRGLLGSNDGGAILDACSSFGVSGYSPPNFLAFNCAASMGDGGVPRLPERILFPTEMSSATLKVGSATDAGDTLKLIARGSDGKQRRNVTLSSALQAVSFTVPATRIKIKAGPVCELVLDDLSFS